VKLFLTLGLWVAISSLALLFLGSLGQVSPGNPVVAVLLGVGILLVVLASFRGLVRSRGPERIEDPGVDGSVKRVMAVATFDTLVTLLVVADMTTKPFL
jgi:hypothetical protein